MTILWRFIKFVPLLIIWIFCLLPQIPCYLYYYPWCGIGKMRKIKKLSLEDSPVIDLILVMEGIYNVATRPFS